VVNQGAQSVSVLISAVGAFGFGAAVGAIVTHLLSARRQRRQEAQERNSLLFLVLAEMLSNDITAYRWSEPLRVREKRGTVPRAEAPPLRTDVWVQARTRLAYLLQFREFYRLVRHYHSVHRWGSTLANETLDYYRDSLRPLTEEAVDVVSKELRKRIPKDFIRGEYAGELQRFNQRTVSLREEALQRSQSPDASRRPQSGA
jgi:hypothetical protein